MKYKYLVSSIVLAIVFKSISQLWSSTCGDCSAPYGFPFRYYHEGDFGVGAAYIWSGVIKELATIVVGGVVIANLWDFLSRRIRKRPTT